MTAWWDYPSNFSNGLEVNSTGTLMQYLDYATGNHIGAMLLIVFGTIVFLSLKSSFSAIKALSSASIVMFFVSIPLAILGILSWVWAVMLGIIAIIIATAMRSDANVGL